jgi:hypothetical protein
MHEKREYRLRHPIRALWHKHRARAARRQIPVEWTFDEFQAFCLRTNYHNEVKNGLTIEREDALKGYSTANCTTLIHLDNSIKGSVIDKWLWARIGGRPRHTA